MAKANATQGIRAVFPSCPLCGCERLQVQTTHEPYDDTDIDYVERGRRTTISRCSRCHAVWSIDQRRSTVYATLQATATRPLEPVTIGRRMPIRYWTRVWNRGAL